MKLSTWMYVAGIGSIILSLVNYLQGKTLPDGDKKNDKQNDGNFLGHWAPSFFILGKVFEDREANAPEHANVLLPRNEA